MEAMPSWRYRTARQLVLRAQSASMHGLIPPLLLAFQTILSKYDSPANQLSYILGVNAGGGLRFVVYETGNGSISRGVDTASGFVPTGTFTHVAATFDPATQAIKIYVNGVDTNAALLAGSASVSAIFESTAAIRI